MRFQDCCLWVSKFCFRDLSSEYWLLSPCPYLSIIIPGPLHWLSGSLCQLFLKFSSDQVTPVLLSSSSTSCGIMSGLPGVALPVLPDPQTVTPHSLLFPTEFSKRTFYYFTHTVTSACNPLSPGCCQLLTPIDTAKPYLDVTFCLKLFQIILSFWDKLTILSSEPLYKNSTAPSTVCLIALSCGCLSSVNFTRQGHLCSSLSSTPGTGPGRPMSPPSWLCCCTSDPGLFPHFFQVKMTAALNQNFLITPHYPSEMLLPPGTHWFFTLNCYNYHKW